jgi:hypothetical protein
MPVALALGQTGKVLILEEVFFRAVRAGICAEGAPSVGLLRTLIVRSERSRWVWQ